MTDKQNDVDPQTGRPWDLSDPNAVQRKREQEQSQQSSSGKQQGTQQGQGQQR